jgi:hypothetical protein
MFWSVAVGINPREEDSWRDNKKNLRNAKMEKEDGRSPNKTG